MSFNPADYPSQFSSALAELKAFLDSPKMKELRKPFPKGLSTISKASLQTFSVEPSNQELLQHVENSLISCNSQVYSLKVTPELAGNDLCIHIRYDHVPLVAAL